MRAASLIPALALALSPAGAPAQLGPDDGPDITVSGQGGAYWFLACEGRTIDGEHFAARAGGPAVADRAGVRFAEVGHLECRIQAGRDAPLTLRLEKDGGQPFCPLAPRAPEDCVERFAPGQHASFEFDAVP